MSETMYIRIRGRVQGPFDEEKVRTLARRGQISRTHQISRDGSNWESAANYPELFTSGLAGADVGQSVNGGASQKAVNPQAAASSGQPDAAAWFYVRNDRECGPVDIDTLRSLFQTGQLGRDALVWKGGMANWQPGHEIPELEANAVGGAVASSSDLGGAIASESQPSAQGRLGKDVQRSLSGSRSWTLFLAIVWYVMAALLLIGGVTLAILGARAGFFRVVANGLFIAVDAVLLGAAGLLLHSFAGRVARFNLRRTEGELLTTLEALRAFWTYVGILTIVFLAFLLSMLIWMISVGAAFPHELLR